MFNGWYECVQDDLLINLNRFECISLQYPDDDFSDRTEACKIVFSRDISVALDDFFLSFTSLEEAKFEFYKIKRAIS